MSARAKLLAVWFMFIRAVAWCVHRLLIVVVYRRRLLP